MKANILNTLIATAILAVSVPALALKEDTQQPVTVTSLKQALDLEKNITTFTDNVVVKQGTIDVRADKVVVTRPGGDSNKMVIEAFGNPVTFYQMQDNGKPIKGRGSKLRYEMANELVTLTGNAYLEQLDSNITGDKITYVVPTQQMQAFSDKGKQVTTVLLPSQLQEKGRKVVEDVTLEVSSGEIVGLLGPNGAGKTTTFYMVVGIVPRDAGAISIDDEDISLLPLHERARKGIGYLPQEASIFRRLTVWQNLMAVLEIRKDLNNDERRERAEELMEEFHISHLRDNLGQSLSGGEPFAGVDPISVIDIKKIIQHLRDYGLGVLITDHNVRETLDVCERAYIVSQGHMIAHGSPESILNNEQVKRVYLGEGFRL